MYRLVFFICLCLSACNDVSVQNADTPQDVSGPGLLIINGNSENFTLVNSLLEAEPKVQHFAMTGGSDRDQTACQIANHIIRFANQIYVTCSGSQDIHIIDRKTLQTVRIIPLPKGSNPWHTLVVRENLAFTSLYLSNEVIAFNPATSEIVGRISLANQQYEVDAGQLALPRPAGMALLDQMLYVAVSNLNAQGLSAGPGYLVGISTVDFQIRKLVKVPGRNTQSLHVGPTEATQRRLYVTNAGSYVLNQGFQGDGSISVYDVDAQTFIFSIAIGGAPASIVFASDATAYVNNAKEGILLSFDAQSLQILGEIDVRQIPCEGRLSPSQQQGGLSFISSLLVADDWLYATEFNSNCLLRIDRKSRSVQRTFKVEGGPQAMVAID